MTDLRANDDNSLRCHDDVIGFVQVTETSEPGSIQGTFVPGPDFDRYRSLFERVFELQRCVEDASTEVYESAWNEWAEALVALRKLDLTFGDERMAVENLEINDQLEIQFKPAIWWTVRRDGERKIL